MEEKKGGKFFFSRGKKGGNVFFEGEKGGQKVFLKRSNWGGNTFFGRKKRRHTFLRVKNDGLDLFLSTIFYFFPKPCQIIRIEKTGTSSSLIG